MLGKARTAVLVWSMGVTQHEYGEDNVRAIINLGLTKGFVGRDKCGLMPIRGHSGVQGGAEMGAYATVLPGGLPIDEANAARFSALWGFEVPATTGHDRPGDDRRRRRGSTRRPDQLGRQLPGGAARPGLVPAGAGTGAAARPRRHRAVQPDAGRPGRHGGAAARGHPLRDPRRGHRDLDRAAGHLQPRDPGSADRRGAPRVAGLRRAGRPGAPGAGRAAPLPGHRRHPRRHRPGGPRL